MRQIELAAPGKVNLHLEVTARMADGYHRLETLFQTLRWADRLELALVERGVHLTCSDPDLPCDERNLAWRAAAAYLALRPGLGGVRIALEKHLPSGGGLGGGSSDAAAVLRGLARLDPDPPDTAVLHRMAAELGSDVPFFLLGGCAHATGRGEALTPLPDPPPTPVTLLVPALTCSTPRVFAALRDAERGPRRTRGPDHWAPRVTADLAGCLHNRLSEAARRAYPALEPLYAHCAATGLPWLLSGSGACCFVLGTVDPPPGVRAVRTGWRSRAELDRVLPAD